MLKQNHIEKKNDKLQVMHSLAKGTQTTTSLVDLNYLEKYDKNKLRTQKYLINYSIIKYFNNNENIKLYIYIYNN